MAFGTTAEMGSGIVILLCMTEIANTSVIADKAAFDMQIRTDDGVAFPVAENCERKHYHLTSELKRPTGSFDHNRDSEATFILNIKRRDKMLFFSAILVFFTIYFGRINAIKLFGNSTIPPDLTTSCADALLADVSCDIAVTYLYPEGYFSTDLLASGCTTACSQSLVAFENNVVTACGSQTFGGEENWDLTRNPVYRVAMIPNRFRFRYGLTCLKDGDRWCNVVAGEAASENNEDSGTLAFARVGDTNSSHSVNSTQIRRRDVSPCDLCFIKSLRYEAAAPYDNGPYLQSDSVYQSFTSSCSVSNLPPTTWTLPYAPTTPTPTPAPTCSGTTYTIRSSDTCYSISQSQSIGTGWLLSDNNLSGFCTGFPTTGSLCIKNTCQIQVVLPTDNCTVIAEANDISVQQLQAWNPILNGRCDNISRLNGTYLCVSNPGGSYTPPTSTIVHPTEITIPAPIPTQTGEGSLSRCGKWHLAVEGEYCNLLAMRYSISLPDFIFLNPSINENCTNLWAEYSYCVEPVGDINTYSGRPGHSATAPTGSYTLVWSNLPAATYTTPTPTATLLPLASGVREDCERYFYGSNYTTGVTGQAGSISACERVANAFGVSLFDLESWNVGLNTSSPACSFDPTKRYCGQWFEGDGTISDDPPPQLLPIRDGTTKNCTEYATVSFGWTCENILTLYGITLTQLYRWNPAIGSDCADLWLEYRYCVSSPDGETPPSSTTSPTPTSTPPTAPAPTQEGQPTNCIAWHKAIAGDGCWKIYTDAGITPANFYAWNPAVGADCANGVWLDYYYCIQISSSSGTTTQPPSSTTSSAAMVTPTPIQENNIISGCKRFDLAVAGDYCAAMAARNTITLSQLGTWNALLKPDGSGCASSFWLGYYYCVGI